MKKVVIGTIFISVCGLALGYWKLQRVLTDAYSINYEPITFI